MLSRRPASGPRASAGSGATTPAAGTTTRWRATSALCRELGGGASRPERYPGSPALARAVLPPDATLALWERDPPSCERLGTTLGADRKDPGDVRGRPRRVSRRRARRGGRAATVVALVDPPFTQKPDWIAVPDAVIAAAAASTRATLLLWYPVKSLTRPNAMIDALQGGRRGSDRRRARDDAARAPAPAPERQRCRARSGLRPVRSRRSPPRRRCSGRGARRVRAVVASRSRRGDRPRAAPSALNAEPLHQPVERRAVDAERACRFGALAVRGVERGADAVGGRAVQRA